MKSLISILITNNTPIISYLNKLLSYSCINPNSNSALISIKKRPMKKLMTMILAVVPFVMVAQGSKDVSANTPDIFNSAYADLGNEYTDKGVKNNDTPILKNNSESTADDDMFKVNDLLLADPDFDVQENMISFTKDQKTVYFSANRTIKAKNVVGLEIKVKKSVQLQLFKAAVKENGEWENLEMLPFNGKRHSTGHPALNKNDTKLYFVSDGPESTGKTDIFVVDLNEDGTYGNPANLGSKINSLERELFPIVDESKVLYFASDIDTDGDELNIFASELIDNELSTPIKLDVQVTDSKDDYIAAFKAVDADAKRLAEEAANLKDLEILLEAENLTEITRVEEVFTESMSGTAYNFNSEDIVYTVQIGAFVENVDTSNYEDSSVLFNHRYDDGYNRFYSGVFQSSDEALKHVEQMKKEGYDDAFVLGLAGKKRFLP